MCDPDDVLRQLHREAEYSPTDEEWEMSCWLGRAADLPGKPPVAMALHLRQMSMERQRQRHLIVTSQDVAGLSLSRVAAYKALKVLESAGLITVDRCRGRAPLVSIIRHEVSRQWENKECPGTDE